MQHAATITAEFVRRIGNQDKQFVAEHSSDLDNAESYPYGVMSDFERFLIRHCQTSMEGCKPLVCSTMDIIEHGLGEHIEALQNIVEVAFIEKLFYDDSELFSWMVDNSGPKLRYELLAFHAMERGYRIINAVREYYSTPPETLAPIMSNLAFLNQLTHLKVPQDGLNVLDTWCHPYNYNLLNQHLEEEIRILICITSIASARGFGKDIQAIG